MRACRFIQNAIQVTTDGREDHRAALIGLLGVALELADGERTGARPASRLNATASATPEPDRPGVARLPVLLQVGEDQADDQRRLEALPERDHESSHQVT